jgi:hydrogenase-4 membrane subunit HyfE
VSSPIIIGCLVLGLGVVVVRRRSLALMLVTAQSLLLAGVALWRVDGHLDRLPAAGGLLLRLIAVATILGIGIARTRETQPVRAGIEPMTRALIALVALLAIPPLVPPLGFGDQNAQHAAIALVVLGIVIALTRRATIVQIIGIVVAENGATLAALSASNAVPAVIELGVIFDLLLIAVVASAFHTRIFGQFGSGDTAHLAELRD